MDMPEPGKRVLVNGRAVQFGDSAAVGYLGAVATVDQVDGNAGPNFVGAHNGRDIDSELFHALEHEIPVVIPAGQSQECDLATQGGEGACGDDRRTAQGHIKAAAGDLTVGD